MNPGLLVPIVVLWLFALARRYLPARAVSAPEPGHSITDLDNRFRSKQWLVGTAMIVVGILFFLSTRAALMWLNRYLANGDGPAKFRLWPQNAIWWFFPFLGAITLSWEIVLQLWADFGNHKDAYQYNYWSVQKSGFDAPRLLRWVAILIVLPIGILTALELSVHASLRENDIHDCGYAFVPCKIYRYSDARRVTVVEGSRDREGRLDARAGVVIDFDDGRRWSSADFGDFSTRVNPELTDFLKNKTNLPLNEAEADSDIPRLDSTARPEKR